MVAADANDVGRVPDLLGSDGPDVNAADQLGQTALHIAADRGRDAILATSIADPRVDINARDSLGRTPLVAGALAGSDAGVKVLLGDRRTDVNLPDRDGQTPLHWAALLGHLGIVRLLLADPRTDPGRTNCPDGRTPAEAAAAAGRYVAEQLIEEHVRQP